MSYRTYQYNNNTRRVCAATNKLIDENQIEWDEHYHHRCVRISLQKKQNPASKKNQPKNSDKIITTTKNTTTKCRYEYYKHGWSFEAVNNAIMLINT